MTTRISERQIVAFRAVMAAGSISGAARQLNVSQPSLSAIIKRMEDVIGLSLFERSHSRLIPSVEAQRIFVEIERVFGQFDQLMGSIQSIARGENALFHVGLSPGISRRVGPRAFAQLVATHPGLRLFCDNLSRNQISDYLFFGRGECVATIVPVNDDAVESTVVGEARLACIVPEEHHLSRLRAIDPSDLVAEPLISFERDTPHGSWIDSLFSNAGLTRDVKVYVKSTETAISCVQERLGLAIVDEFAAVECEHVGLVAILMAASPAIPIYVHWSKHRPRTRLVEEFVEALRSTLNSIKAKPSSL